MLTFQLYLVIFRLLFSKSGCGRTLPPKGFVTGYISATQVQGCVIKQLAWWADDWLVGGKGGGHESHNRHLPYYKLYDSMWNFKNVSSTQDFPPPLLKSWLLQWNINNQCLFECSQFTVLVHMLTESLEEELGWMWAEIILEEKFLLNFNNYIWLLGKPSDISSTSCKLFKSSSEANDFSTVTRPCTLLIDCCWLIDSGSMNRASGPNVRTRSLRFSSVRFSTTRV